jgi:hypothetical protein
MKRTHKPIGRYLFVAWIIFLYIFAGYYVLRSENQPLIDNAYFKVPQDFRSRLRKHGLDKQFSIVEISNGKLYFYKDGKKCTF